MTMTPKAISTATSLFIGLAVCALSGDARATGFCSTALPGFGWVWTGQHGRLSEAREG
jgi:hypothetical protein